MRIVSLVDFLFSSCFFLMDSLARSMNCINESLLTDDKVNCFNILIQI